MASPHGRPVPRRPAHFGPAAMEAHGGVTPGPAETTQIAHETAAALLGRGRSAHDPELTARLVALVDEIGLSTLADLWSTRPARTLPGALWRLYVLREWVRRTPESAAEQYAAGMAFAEVAKAVAGVAEPPGPDDVVRVADEILTGVFDGDFATALDRAAAFCAVVASGRASLADRYDDAAASDRATALTASAAALQSTGLDLRACAALWREGALD